MRDDLLDAEASIDWAVAQLPLVQQGFTAWQNTRPYDFTVEDDPKTGNKLVLAIERTPLPLILNVQAVAVIHFLRSSLDLIAAALAKRNGVVPGRNTHFPIYRDAAAASHPDRGLDSAKCKQWLSDSERAAMKALMPYGGGDPDIWPMSELDILSKHERLVRAAVNPMGSMLLGHARMAVTGMRTVRRRTDKETILAELPPGDPFTPHHGNTLLAIDIAIDEPRLGLSNETVVPLLRRFAVRTREILNTFN